MSCEICDQKQNEYIIYSDDRIIIMQAKDSYALGHLQIFSKKHFNIFELLPDDDVGYLFNVANKMSMMLFQVLNCNGTNILVQNGIPAGQKIAHFCINIIPRKDDDNMNILWQPKQSSAEELESVQKKLSESIANDELPTHSKPLEIQNKKEEKVLKANPEKENYLLKQLRRIP